MILNNEKGFVLIISVLILASLLMIGTYILSIANTESKISGAQALATKNYYHAEAGVYDMLWKINNDTNVKNDFLNGSLSSANDITRNSLFGDSAASYRVTAISTAPAEAWVIATSTYQLGSVTSQRVVKSYITKATNQSGEWEFTTFAGGRGGQQNGNFTFKGAGVVLVSEGGRLHANQVLKVQGSEIQVNNGAVTSSNVINVVSGGTLTLNNSYSDAPTSTVDMLQIDFDEWKSKATTVYTPNQFKNLPNNTVLDGIIYVTGEADITGKNMTINGLLFSDGTIEITLAGRTLTVTAPVSTGGGLISKEGIDITTSGGSVNIEGLVYAADDLEITSAGTNFNIYGSLTGFDADITASGGAIHLFYAPQNLESILGAILNPDAPLIQIDHWEEQY